MAPGGAPPMSTLVWAGWLGVAITAHFMIALFGVLSRYLQVKTHPPVPALRLLLLVSLLGFATQLLFYSVPVFILRKIKERRSKRRGALQQEAAAEVEGSEPALGGDGDRQEQAQAASDDVESEHRGPGHAPPSQQLRVKQPKSSVRPEMPMSRGLSARFETLEARRPQLMRGLALASMTACGIAAGALQIGALGFVDASIVQLVQMFTVLFIAIFQAGLLHHRIPILLWPTAAVMVAGAAMVIVPTIKRGGPGSLGSAKSYLGLAMAVGYMFCMATYFILLQASRHMHFSSLYIQYCFMVASIAVLLPITLPLNGTNWAADMAPWSAVDWVVLVVLGTVVCIGAGVLIQHATWKLSAPTVSLFYGLRLVFTVVQSKAILGATIIQTPLQIGGIVVTAGAVSAYMGYQYLNLRRQAAAVKAADKAGDLDGIPETPGTKKLGDEDEQAGDLLAPGGDLAVDLLPPPARPPAASAAQQQV